jgi:hypothetical protein
MTRAPPMPSSVQAAWPSTEPKPLFGENLVDLGGEMGRSKKGEVPIRSTASSLAAATIPERNREVLLWHWGRAGGGSNLTYELARELRNVPGIELTVSAAEATQLAELVGSDANIAIRKVRTFEGDKTSVAGKLGAVLGLIGLPRLARDFRRILSERPTDVAICTMPSIWDVAAVPILRQHTSRFILILHDAQLHPGDYYPFRETVRRWEIASADALIVLSEHVGRAAQQLYNFPPDRIWTVPHGAFSFGAGVAAPRAFPSNRPVRLLFFGRIVKYKGLATCSRPTTFCANAMLPSSSKLSALAILLLTRRNLPVCRI